MRFLIQLVFFIGWSNFVAGQSWTTVDTENTCTERHECSGAAIDGKLYLIGGRGMKPVEEYDPATGKWRTMAMPPMEIHHFQAVAHQGKIYIIGALTGSYPHETPLTHVYTFDPKKNIWEKGHEIPEERRRGAAGLVVKEDKLYLMGGIKDGHWADNRDYFDEYNPTTGKWTILPNLPRVRDHFQGVLLDEKIYAVGGRKSFAKEGHNFDLTYAEVDVFNFKNNTWETLPSAHNLPTERAGSSTIAYEQGFLVVGGESASQETAHSEVEYYQPHTGWKLLNNLERGRHGFPLVKINHSIYVAAGCGNRGGSPELNSLEVME